MKFVKYTISDFDEVFSTYPEFFYKYNLSKRFYNFGAEILPPKVELQNSYERRYTGFDDEVLEAIYHHTDGLSNGKLSKILYIADKREPLRGLDPHILNLAYTDLNKAFIELKEDVKEYLANRNE